MQRRSHSLQIKRVTSGRGPLTAYATTYSLQFKSVSIHIIWYDQSIWISISCSGLQSITNELDYSNRFILGMKPYSLNVMLRSLRVPWIVSKNSEWSGSSITITDYSGVSAIETTGTIYSIFYGLRGFADSIHQSATNTKAIRSTQADSLLIIYTYTYLMNSRDNLDCVLSPV